MAPPLRIQLRGELTVEVRGSRVEGGLPGRLGRALLAYLVLNRNRAVTRSELVDALWPQRPPRDPAATLSTLLSSLRRTLGAEVLTGRSELRLTFPEGSEVDLEQAAEALASARTALPEDPERACALAETCLDIYEHPLVPLFDAPWLDDHRREEEDAELDALELLAQASLAVGGEGVARAQLAARRLVEMAPFRESGHALLMRAHAARGNHAEALRAFERLRVLLRDELGSTPSPELRALHEEMLSAAGRTAPAAAELAPAPELPLPSALAKVEGRAFVGREGALDRLRSELATATAGDRRFALTAGEPGIGKTTLAAVFAREASRDGAIVMYGRSDEETLVAYQPFVDVISHLVLSGQVDHLGESLQFELEELGRLMPELRRHFPAARETSAGLPETDRYRLFEAVITTLGRVAAERTLVLVLDDLHWADPPTLRLVRHLARSAQPSRLLVLGTYRDEEVAADSPLAELIGDVRRERPLEVIELRGLDDKETAALIEAYQGAAPAPGVAERLHERTGGNPFFLEESLRAADDAVPAGVREVVLARVARLGPHGAQVLGVGAVIGASFPAEAIPPVADLAPPAVADVLDRAVAARLLSPVDRSGRLSFAHTLIRRTLYDELGPVVRTHLHARAAETLLSRRPELRPHPAELALHFYEARHSLGPGPALRYSREAADAAAASLAWEDAAVQLERALELDELREPANPADRCELLLRLGEMRVLAGQPGFSVAFAEAAELARGRSSTQLARAAIGYAGHYYEAGVIDDSLIALLREALTELPEDELDLRARALARLAEILHFAGDESASPELSSEAVMIAYDLGDDHVLSAALAGRHVSLLHVSHLAERLAMSDELIRIATKGGDRDRRLQALHARAFDLMEAGQIDAARACLDELATAADQVRQPLFAHFAVGWNGCLAAMEGRLDEAERLAADSLAMRKRMETADADSVFAAQLFLIRIAQGRLRELVAAVEHFVGEYPQLAAWRAGLPLAYVADGREQEGTRELERIVAGLDALPKDFFWLTTVGLLAEASGKLRHPASAELLYAALAPYEDCMVQVGYAGSLGPVSRLLGLLAAARGDREAATAHLGSAVATTSAVGLRLFETQARAELEELVSASA